MAIRGVVGHEIDHDPDATVVRPSHELVEVGKAAEDRVDVAVVGHVVAEVGHRRAIKRRDPDRVHAQRVGSAVVEVVEMGRDPGEIAHAVAVRVGEAARVDLVEDGPLPPVAVEGGHGCPFKAGSALPCRSSQPGPPARPRDQPGL